MTHTLVEYQSVKGGIRAIDGNRVQREVVWERRMRWRALMSEKIK